MAFDIFTILAIIGWLIPIVLLFIVPENRKPSSATAWLLLAFMLPYLGAILFLLLGSPKLSRKRLEEQRTMDSLISKAIMEARSEPGLDALLDPTILLRYQPFVKLNTNLGHLPAFSGNGVELLPEYDHSLQRMADDIERAHSYVHVEYFAISRDEETECVFAAMEHAASRGVRVRVLMDHLGSRKYPHFDEMREKLTTVGIENHLMLPLRFFREGYTRPDLRNHRKIVVIDGRVGYTGSQNLIRRNYFRKDAIYYRELVARVTGPVVAQLEAAFVTDWYSETGVLLDRQLTSQTIFEPAESGNALCQVLPSGSGFQDENNLKLFTALIHSARHTLVITNPYFVPDDALMTAITSAAQRGVDVSLVNSEVSDQFLVSHAEHSYYEDLLRSGVKIYRYGSPVLLHSKHMSFDDDIAVIGSSNLDIRSFQLNLEVTLVCYDQQVVSALRKVEAADRSLCRRVELDEWQKRGTREKLFENISRLTAALQ